MIVPKMTPKTIRLCKQALLDRRAELERALARVCPRVTRDINLRDLSEVRTALHDLGHREYRSHTL